MLFFRSLAYPPPVPVLVLGWLTPVRANLVRNYEPHMEPNVDTAPVTVELRNALTDTAKTMLKRYLRRWRKETTMTKDQVPEAVSFLCLPGSEFG